MSRVQRAVFVLLLLVAVGASSAAIAAPGTTPLVGRHKVGYSVRLPAAWRFKNASYPSDHATHLWWNPSNALAKMEVVLSACVGCVSKNLDGKTPNPRGELPQGAIRHVINPYTLGFLTYSSDDPYPDNGVIYVTHAGSRITGSVIVHLWLPKSQHALATRILNSFRPTQ